MNCNDSFGLTQNDINAAYQAIQQTYPDLKFPNSIGIGYNWPQDINSAMDRLIL